VIRAPIDETRQQHKNDPKTTDLLDIALELLVPDRQGVEELLQADGGALLPWMGRPLH